MAIRSLFVLLMAVTVTLITSATYPAEEPSCSDTKDQRSLLSSILLMTGYSDACVATALDMCSSGHGETPYASLIEEARQVVQQASAAITKWDSQLSAAVNTTESQLSAVVNMLSVVLNQSESETSVILNQSESSETSVILNQSESSETSVILNQSESGTSVVLNQSESVTSAAEDTSEAWPRQCQELKDSGDHGSGPRRVYPYADRPLDGVTVVCEQDIDGGGWTVFQRRSSDAERQDFYTTWHHYQDGFGDLQGGEFWGGLDLLHQLTSTPSQLRIDLHDYEGEHRWAKYGQFSVGGPDTNYRLTIAQYSGDAGDGLAHNNGQPFSTRDADHDSHSRNCAAERQGAWWYNSNCGYSNLNGYQRVGDDSGDWQGIYWQRWTGYRYYLKQTTMMTRPA